MDSKWNQNWFKWNQEVMWMLMWSCGRGIRNRNDQNKVTPWTSQLDSSSFLSFSLLSLLFSSFLSLSLKANPLSFEPVFIFIPVVLECAIFIPVTPDYLKSASWSKKMRMEEEKRWRWRKRKDEDGEKEKMKMDWHEGGNARGNSWIKQTRLDDLFLLSIF